jgi:hypothetical protein
MIVKATITVQFIGRKMEETITPVKKAKNMDIPPIKAVGVECHRSFLGATIQPRKFASRMTNGVKTKDKTSEITPNSNIK